MATLEKIRSKSVFLIVVIGLALLAFIIGDALTNSRNIFGNHNMVAKIGSTKIDIMEYQRKREELNNQLEEARKQNPAQVANFDVQLLPQMAVTQLLQEGLLLDAADKAGIQSSSNLLRYYMLENPQNQEVMKVVSQMNQLGLSVQTPQQAYEVIFNPKRNGLTDAQVEPYQRLWLAAEQNTEKMICESIYQRLLVNSVKPNDLDKKALYNDYVNTTNVDVAYLPYGTLDAKEYPVSESDLKAAYDAKKGMFKVEETTKDVDFIAVNITPSTKDREDAKALAEKTVASLKDSASQLSKDIKKEGVSMSRRRFRGTDIQNSAIKEFVLSAPKDSVKLISQNIQGFTAVRMVSHTTAVDSIKLNIVSAINETYGKKVMAALNAGLPIDSVSKKFSADSVAAQPDQWLQLYTAQGPTSVLPQEQLDSIKNAAGKYVSLQAGPQGMVMASLVKENPSVNVYEYDEVTYVLGPSTATVNSEREKLEKFLEANKTAKDFAKNAEKAGYNVQRYSFTQSTPAVPRMAGMNVYFPDSRQVVRWVMIDGSENEVSHIYESKSATNPMLFAVAVEREYDEYVPLSNPDVTQLLTNQVRASKAGDKLVAKFKKSTGSVASAAQAMGVQVQNLNTFRFGNNMGVPDAEVMGAINGAKASNKVVLVKGENGVYAYKVNGKNTEKFPYNEQTYEQQYYQLVNPNLIEMIQGTKKLQNQIYKFESGD